MPKRKTQTAKKPHADAAVRMTTGEATVGALIAHGIDTIYALPGVHNDFFFDALFKASDCIKTIHSRHEQGAAYMALGAALATNKPHPYAVVPGPGLLFIFGGLGVLGGEFEWARRLHERMHRTFRRATGRTDVE